MMCSYFSAVSHTLLCANHKMQHGNILSAAKISLLQAIYCCMLNINCSKVIFFQVIIFPCCKPYIAVCSALSAARPSFIVR